MSAKEELEKDQATGWQTLLSFGKANDDKTLSDWKDELANLLTFTGLFSAVVTGFIVLAVPLLQEDFGEKSAKLLGQISLQLSSFHAGSQFINSTILPEPDTPFQPDQQAVQINILWIASLTLTLMASFFTIAAQQWLRCIPLPPHLTIREAVRLRHFRHDGLIRWKVPTIISLLPVVVQISVVLFLVGLLLLLDSINSTIATVFAILAGSTLGLFLIMIVLPVFDRSCPYKTPIIPTFIAFSQLGAIVIVAVTVSAAAIVAGASVMTMATIWNIGARLRRLGKRMSSPPVRNLRNLSRPGIAPLHNTTIDGLFLWCFHTVTTILARCFSNTGQFWVEHELPIIGDEDMDRKALSDAPTVVPKASLATLQPCVDAVGDVDRLRVACSWVQHILNLTTDFALLLHSQLHAPTFTGPLRNAMPSTFLPLRELLWHVVPTNWDTGSPTFPHIFPFSTASPHFRNNLLGIMLCLMYRSIPEATDTPPNDFLIQFGERLSTIRESQNPKDVIHYSLKGIYVVPSDVDARTMPTSLLFLCCQRGFRLEKDRLIASSRWATTLHQHLLTGILSTYKRNPRAYAPNLMRLQEVSVTSIAIVIQAVAEDPTLLVEDDVRTLLDTSAEIIRKLRSPLMTYSRHIGVMPAGKHIVACNEAIEVIVRSLLRLTKDGHLGQTVNCPSRKIMADLKDVCDANWEKNFMEARADLEEYAQLYGY